MPAKSRGRGAERDRDGLPVPDAPLSPNQRAIRNLVITGFGGSVHKLASAVGTEPQTVYKWINGLSEPNRVNLAAVAEAAGVGVEDLWVPDPDAIYFRGAVIRGTGKTRELYEELSRHAEAVVKHHSPSLAKKLGL